MAKATPEQRVQKALDRAAYIAAHRRFAVTGSHKPGGIVNPRYGPIDWRAYRVRFSVPILFKTEAEAWQYGHDHLFKNMTHDGQPIRKASYSVKSVWIP